MVNIWLFNKYNLLLMKDEIMTKMYRILVCLFAALIHELKRLLWLLCCVCGAANAVIALFLNKANLLCVCELPSHCDWTLMLRSLLCNSISCLSPEYKPFRGALYQRDRTQQHAWAFTNVASSARFRASTRQREVNKKKYAHMFSL